jgi:hypothetical protein
MGIRRGQDGRIIAQVIAYLGFCGPIDHPSRLSFF